MKYGNNRAESAGDHNASNKNSGRDMYGRSGKKADPGKPDSLLGRAGRTMRVRSLAVVAVATVAAAALIGRLFYLQVIQNEKYKELVIEQMVYEVSVSAGRGIIYDRNKTALATNYTTERVFISPYDMESDEERELVAKGLSEILDVDYDSIIAKTKKVNRKDETIKKNVELEDADRVRAFILENELSHCIHLVETSSRLYPYSTLASHVLGFCGADGGLYGLEFRYNDILSGVSGKIVTAQNGRSGDMPYEYEQYINAENGANLITTLDLKIQSFLEKYLEQAVLDSGAKSRGCGIVMNPKTGEIYGMATYPAYDSNSPYTIPAYYNAELQQLKDSYGEETAQYKNGTSNLLYRIWNNKAITETYEPGSTAKVMTTSVALEEGAASLSDSFYCPGYYTVAGWSSRIHCHKTTGHGMLSFSEALQQSCNPAMMMLAERIGAKTFFRYFGSFGLTEKTGIDLPGEASSIYTSSLTSVDLAVYAFGQSYNVTPIQLITAIAAVANGGNLVTPYVVSEITDDDGNTLASVEPVIKRQVISRETASTISSILEAGVSGNGGAKNAAVRGYTVAAKTGTSEKGRGTGKRIASTVAYAPAEDPEVIVLLVIDEPTVGSIYGSTVAAPYVSKILADTLPYLGIEPSEREKDSLLLPNFRGVSLDAATMALRSLGLSYEVMGSGNSVISQIPLSGSSVSKKSGKVLLYTDTETEVKSAAVPSVIGKSAEEAESILREAGFNVTVVGTPETAGTVVFRQTPSAGSVTSKGDVVEIEMRDMNGTD